jgi:hypothetical protein
MKKNGKIYFPRLESEITKRELTKEEIIKKLAINRGSFTYKLNGERPFTLEQGLIIWKTWFSDIPIDELFQKNE